jgi:hypothetical protein
MKIDMANAIVIPKDPEKPLIISDSWKNIDFTGCTMLDICDVGIEVATMENVSITRCTFVTHKGLRWYVKLAIWVLRKRSPK